MIASNILATSIILQGYGCPKMGALRLSFKAHTRKLPKDFRVALWNLLTGLPVPQELA